MTPRQFNTGDLGGTNLTSSCYARAPEGNRASGSPLLHPEITWAPPPAQSFLGQGELTTELFQFEAAEVHVWAAALDIPAPGLKQAAACFSPSEMERAARFHFGLHRDRFVAGRSLLRILLGRYLGVVPAAIEFTAGINGKPALAGPFTQCALEFNLAHSENLALLAVTRAGPVGVDVEAARPLDDFVELVERFFSPRERWLFRRLPDDQKPAAFFNLWTRKEAWLKATGEGIAGLLNRVEVSFLPGEQARLLEVPRKLAAGRSWQLCDLSPAVGFVGALALGAAELRVRCLGLTSSFWHE